MTERLEQTKIMHRIVTHNGTVYLGGIVADDTTASMTEQTSQICKKIDKYLALAGSDKTKILSAQLFITDMSKKEEMNTAWVDWMPAENLPARATVGVADLGSPTTLIEVVVTAHT